MNSNTQLKVGILLSYLSIFVNIVVGLIYTPWMINTIGKSHYGLYTLATSLITLFLVDFGLSAATSRYVSKYRAEGREDKVNSFLGAVYKLYLWIDAIILGIFLVLFFFLEEIYTGLTPAELSQFRIVYIIVAFSSVLNFPFVTFNGILTAYEKFIPLKAADLIYRCLVVGLTVLALLLGMGLYAIVTVNAIAAFSVIVFKFVFIRTGTPVKVDFRHVEKGIYKEIFSFSIWVTIASLAQRLIFNISPTILGIVSDSAAIATFGLVVTIEGYSYLITSVFNGMFIPKISRIYAEDKAEKLNPLLLTTGRFQFALSGLIVAGFALLGKDFIRLWMGDGYTDAYFGLCLVLLPGLFYNAMEIANTALTVTKRVNLQAYVSLATALVNVALSFWLSAQYGAVGACLSIFIAYIVRSILSTIVYYKVLHIDLWGFVKRCYLRMGLPILCTIAAGIGLNRLLPQTAWLPFLTKGAALVLVYLIAVFLLGVSGAERRAIFQKIKQKLSRKAS